MRVFISSTITDMMPERNAASQVVQSLNYVVSRSEFYPSMSKSPKEICLDEARNSDIFIGIYKKRYGFIPTEDNFLQYSVTQMEYETAKRNQVPCLIFVSDEEEREERLEIFLQRVKHFSTGQYVSKFQSVDDLKYQVLRSLIYHLKLIVSESDFKKYRNLLPKEDPNPYSGNLNWAVLDYDECESIGCFSGIRIGEKVIYLKNPYAGNVHFYLYDNIESRSTTDRTVLSLAEFNKINQSIFTENDIYWIEKYVWRTSS